MLNLINNQFKPNQYVSNNEVNQVLEVVKEIIDSTKIDETNNDYIDYQDDVKVIEDTFVQTSNNTIILDDDNNIQKGDLVVVNGDKADGIAMKVENVQEQGNQLQIQYSQPSLEDILESLHVEGKLLTIQMQHLHQQMELSLKINQVHEVELNMIVYH